MIGRVTCNLHASEFTMKNNLNNRVISITYVLNREFPTLLTIYNVYRVFKRCWNAWIFKIEAEVFNFGQGTDIAKWILCWTFESTVLDALKYLPWNSFLRSPLAEVKRFPFISPKLELPIPLEHSLNIIHCPVWGQTPYQNLIFLKILRADTARII